MFSGEVVYERKVYQLSALGNYSRLYGYHLSDYLFPIVSFQGISYILQETQQHFDAGYYRCCYRILDKSSRELFRRIVYKAFPENEAFGKKSPRDIFVDFRISFHGGFPLFGILFNLSNFAGIIPEHKKLRFKF